MSILNSTNIFHQKHILVIGDIMLDEFIYTTSTRNSTEYTNTPILEILSKQNYLGGAANVALNLKKLGATPYLIGITGDDVAKENIIDLLKSNSISTQYLLIHKQQKTILKKRIFRDNQSIFRIDEEEKNALNTDENNSVLNSIKKIIVENKIDAILLQDYNKGVLNTESIPKILSLAKQNNICITVDPKFENWELYSNVDLFKPNLNEFLFMANQLKCKEKSLEKIAEIIQQKINFKNLLVTLGKDGNFIFNENESKYNTIEVSKQAEKPNVCGAGDTVIAVATLALTSKLSLEEIALLTNKAGNIVCQKEAIQPIFYEELFD